MAGKRLNAIILGAAGRDFHNFNVSFRTNPAYRIVAFTATQIPNIQGRRYPPELAGDLYPEGIPIHPEAELDDLIRRHQVDEVVFAYSDVPHELVMHRASQVLAAGADFRLLGMGSTTLQSRKPTVAVCAVRTGAGKSQTTRHTCDILQQMGKRVVAVRHPMPYGDLASQAIQRFATYEDMDRHHCTIEEREEYEPLIDRGVVVYAGVDYEPILRLAEEEADVVICDGGNNDLPFYRPHLHVVVVDPHRPGHEFHYHPGEANLRAADVVVINKVDTAGPDGVATVRENVRTANPQAIVIEAASPIYVEDPEAIRGKRVLVIEDGPTLTHGEMSYGAGVVAARRFGAAELIDPRPYAARSIAAVFESHPHIGPLLPAMGYGEEQVRDLEETVNAAECDLVLAATPIDLRRLLDVRHPIDRVRYELQVIGRPTLSEILERRFM
jgi:predicted GTPase